MPSQVVLLAILGLIAAAFVLWKLLARLSPRRARFDVTHAIQAVLEPARLGDYTKALEACEGLRRANQVTAPYCFFRGYNLMRLGRLEEAEQWLRRNIAMEQGNKRQRFVAIGFSTLGHLMLQAGRYSEAQECFENSLREFPERGSGYRSMAELCLLRGDSPAEAVRWAGLAIEREQADQQLDKLRGVNLGEELAVLAWATAASSHDATEVARLVAEALSSVGESYAGSTAQVHYHSARAYTELGDNQASAGHYEQAAQLDPQGHWGRVAQAALRSANRSDGP